jgi:hypothetical protein
MVQRDAAHHRWKGEMPSTTDGRSMIACILLSLAGVLHRVECGPGLGLEFRCVGFGHGHGLNHHCVEIFPGFGHELGLDFRCVRFGHGLYPCCVDLGYGLK